MQIGFIGLGKMGSRMALKLILGNHDVIVWNRSIQPITDLQEQFKIQSSKFKIESQNVKVARSIEELIKSLSTPRIIWLMLPAGDVTGGMLENLKPLLEKGDIVIDGGNAHFSDTQKRYEAFAALGIQYLGIGVSGGIIAEQNGYPLMVGGDKGAYDHIIPLLDTLIQPNGGHDYFGEGGAGHFVKMVHNAVEYGMMQAIGEGFEVMKKSSYSFDLLQIAKLWQKGTIVSSFLIDRGADALAKDASLATITGVIPRGGEGDWTVDVAQKEHIAVPVIQTAVDYRKKSESDISVQESYTAKMINALRHEFGGHEVKQKK